MRNHNHSYYSFCPSLDFPEESQYPQPTNSSNIPQDILNNSYTSSFSTQIHQQNLSHNVAVFSVVLAAPSVRILSNPIPTAKHSASNRATKQAHRLNNQKPKKKQLHRQTPSTSASTFAFAYTFPVSQRRRRRNTRTKV